MSTKTILLLAYLDDRGEVYEELEVSDDVQLARLTAATERGGDAYSLACSSYLFV